MNPSTAGQISTETGHLRELSGTFRIPSETAPGTLRCASMTGLPRDLTFPTGPGGVLEQVRLWLKSKRTFGLRVLSSLFQLCKRSSEVSLPNKTKTKLENKIQNGVSFMFCEYFPFRKHPKNRCELKCTQENKTTLDH